MPTVLLVGNAPPYYSTLEKFIGSKGASAGQGTWSDYAREIYQRGEVALQQ